VIKNLELSTEDIFLSGNSMKTTKIKALPDLCAVRFLASKKESSTAAI
jgi:hypothetical protein